MEKTDEIFAALLDVVKCSNGLPKLGRDFELLASYPNFADLLKTEGDRLFQLLKTVLLRSNTKVTLTDRDTLDEIVELLEKANDVLAERTANSIDESEGRRKQEDLVVVTKKDATFRSCNFINTSWNKRLKLDTNSNFAKNGPSNDKSASKSDLSQEVRLFASKNVARPQFMFQELIDNSNKPFVSKLKLKHNAKQLNKSRLTIVVDSKVVDSKQISADCAKSENPYRYELEHFVPNEKNMKEPQIRDLTEISFNPLQIIDSEEKLDKLCKFLKESGEFAVDLEHHSYRSFLGLTCLMQISVRSCDFIVDTLKLWKHMHVLNDPFTDPAVLKVFHGADRDVEWLQRDFGIYVVNMFDTSQAMRVLGMARFSLAHLIKSYFNIELNKQFQLADWRIRPLPEPLIKYARNDTRYLLDCYDRLKKDLLDRGNERKNLLISVFERSRDICLHHYEKPLLGERDYLRLCAASKKSLNQRQLRALRDLYAWRDKTARLEDESPAYVLPDHMLRQIAEVLPREMQGVLSCCNPAPPLVRRELRELHEIVIKARESPLEPAVSVTTFSTEPVDSSGGVIPDHHHNRPISIIARPHDFSHAAEDEEIVPLSRRITNRLLSLIRVKCAPSLLF